MTPTLCDVGPRDGLQNEPVTLPPRLRAALAERLTGVGLPYVEVASFVNPARVPQMSGAEEVVASLGDAARTRAAGLVLNLKGFERARSTGLRRLHFAFAATETFNRRNANASLEQALSAASSIVRAAQLAGVASSVTIGAAFGCPYEGSVSLEQILALVERLIADGAPEIVLADTIGVATPLHVRRAVERTLTVVPRVGVHLHNTRGTGIANAFAAIEAGASWLDASVGGIGGCPFAPKATGNISTEDLVYMLEQDGVSTGVDLDRLIRIAEWLEGVLGRPLPGMVYRAGGRSLTKL